MSINKCMIGFFLTVACNMSADVTSTVTTYAKSATSAQLGVIGGATMAAVYGISLYSVDIPCLRPVLSISSTTYVIAKYVESYESIRNYVDEIKLENSCGEKGEAALWTTAALAPCASSLLYYYNRDAIKEFVKSLIS